MRVPVPYGLASVPARVPLPVQQPVRVLPGQRQGWQASGNGPADPVPVLPGAHRRQLGADRVRHLRLAHRLILSSAVTCTTGAVTFAASSASSAPTGSAVCLEPGRPAPSCLGACTVTRTAARAGQYATDSRADHRSTGTAAAARTARTAATGSSNGTTAR